MRRALLLATLALAPIVPAAGQSQGPSPQFVGVPAFDLSFNGPVAIVTPPGETGRVFVVEKAGIISAINLAQPRKATFLDITAKVGNGGGERGLLALAFHPDFARNRQFFVWYTSTANGGLEDRLARFQASADGTTADAATEQILIAQPDDAPNHNGGEVLFGADGYLYFSVGDEGSANDNLQNSQRIDKDYLSGVFRIDVDKRPGNPAPNAHPAVRTGTYSVPRDNPYVGATTFNGRSVDPANVRTEFWAVGLRNLWRMAFDPVTGALWGADVGQGSLEEIDVIVKGGNYGWSFREGTRQARGGAPAGFTSIDPVWEYPRSEGGSVTGGFVYRTPAGATANAAMRPLEGKYLFADYASGKVWALTPDGTRPVTADKVQQIAQIERITSFGRDPRTGDVLVATLNGSVLRLVPADVRSK